MRASTWTRATAVARLILATSLLPIGCGSEPDRPVAPEFRGVVNQPPVDSPPLRLTDQQGEPFDLADLRGQVVVIDFWGVW